MFNNKKQQEELQEILVELKKLQVKSTDSQKAIKLQEDKIQKQQAFLEKLGAEHKDVLHHMREGVDELHLITKDAQAEVHNLRTTRVEFKDDVTATFKQQLTASLKTMENTLDVDTKKIEEMAEAFSSLKNDLISAKTSIEQFKELAKTIKESDYELKTHIQALEKADNEKVRLLKRIDELEGMIAKFKRGNGPRQQGPRF